VLRYRVEIGLRLGEVQTDVAWEGSHRVAEQTPRRLRLAGTMETTRVVVQRQGSRAAIPHDDGLLVGSRYELPIDRLSGAVLSALGFDGLGRRGRDGLPQHMVGYRASDQGDSTAKVVLAVWSRTASCSSPAGGDVGTRQVAGGEGFWSFSALGVEQRVEVRVTLLDG
jgi:hypothetical protein